MRWADPANGDYRVKKDSPALALGYRNFRMHRFGVRKPALRAIARTPDLPVLRAAPEPAQRDSASHDWRGARVRNVVGRGEMSAFGTPGETGVLVLAPGSSLVTSGLRKYDVIFSFEGRRIDSIADLLLHDAEQKAEREVRLVVLRAQKRTALTLRTFVDTPSSTEPLQGRDIP